jgi:hypothetical protein
VTEFTDATARIDADYAADREAVDAVRAEMAAEDAWFAGLPPHIRWYFGHPGAWDSVKDAIRNHDQTCRSLKDIWLARTGGVSCPSDLARCDDCGVMFYNEGLLGQYPPGWKTGDPILETEDPDEPGEFYEATLCECCGRKRLHHDTISAPE